MLPKKFRNIFVAETMFPSLPTSFQHIGRTNTAKRMMVHHVSNILDQFAHTIKHGKAMGEAMFENIFIQ
jgi:hypothetical protein